MVMETPNRSGTEYNKNNKYYNRREKHIFLSKFRYTCRTILTWECEFFYLVKVFCYQRLYASHPMRQARVYVLCICMKRIYIYGQCIVSCTYIVGTYIYMLGTYLVQTKISWKLVQIMAKISSKFTKKIWHVDDTMIYNVVKYLV